MISPRQFIFRIKPNILFYFLDIFIHRKQTIEHNTNQIKLNNN